MGDGNVQISVTVDGQVNQLLERYSKEFELTKSKFTRNLIYVSLDSFKLFKLTGFALAATKFRKLCEVYITHEDMKNCIITTKDRDPVTFSVGIDEQANELIKKYADYVELPKKVFVRNLIYVGLEEFQILRMAGFGKLAKLADGFNSFIRKFKDDDLNGENKKK